MHNELKVAATWILGTVMARCDCIALPDLHPDIFFPSPNQIPLDQLKLFEISIQRVLAKSFKDIWFVSEPTRYQAYRAIHVSPQFPVNEFIKRAADRVGIRYDMLGLSDMNFTIWIDPNQVTTRFNDNDPVHILYQNSTLPS